MGANLELIRSTYEGKSEDNGRNLLAALVIRNQDTFTLAPWKPALVPMHGLQVSGLIGPHRVAWTLDRERSLPPRP